MSETPLLFSRPGYILHAYTSLPTTLATSGGISQRDIPQQKHPTLPLAANKTPSDALLHFVLSSLHYSLPPSLQIAAPRRGRLPHHSLPAAVTSDPRPPIWVTPKLGQ